MLCLMLPWRVGLSHLADVRDSLLAWFREAVTAEMDAAGLDERGAPQALPSRFADVLFVPDWFLNAKQLGAAQEFVSHPCLMCPLARALFWVLLKQRWASVKIAYCPAHLR